MVHGHSYGRKRALQRPQQLALHAQISSLIQRCEDFGMPLQQMGAVRSLLLHAGADK